LRHPKRAEEVRFHLRAGFGFADFFDRAEKAVTRIIDCDVDASEALDRLRYGGIDRGLLRHVESDGECSISVPRFERANGGDVARRHRDAIASLESRLGPNTAESLRGSRNEPNFAC
jgi:hypothetical protein